MRQITPHLLWLGHAGDGTNFRQIFDLGIRAIVQLASEEPPPRTPRDLLFCRFPLTDGLGNDAAVLELSVRTVAGLLRLQVPTLICCGAGMSRSPAVAAAALSLLIQESPDDCLWRVTEHHPADITPGLWQDIKKVLGLGEP